MHRPLRFKTGEYVMDNDIVARIQMWLIDDDYMARTDVHALVLAALEEIESLRSDIKQLRENERFERELSDALARITGALVLIMPDDIIGGLGDVVFKIENVLNDWRSRRDLEEDDD